MACVQNPLPEGFTAQYRHLLGIWVAAASPLVMRQLSVEFTQQLSVICQDLCGSCRETTLHPLVGNTLVRSMGLCHCSFRIQCVVNATTNLEQYVDH